MIPNNDSLFRKIRYLDGGMGSMLLATADMPIGYPPERLNLEQPDAVIRVHRAYVDAGAELIYANTFGANGIKFPDCLEAMISEAIAHARTAAGDRAYVALDIGSLGKLIGEGGISPEHAYDEFARIIRAGQDRTDCIVIETMTDLAEARMAVLAAKENSTLPVMVSMSFSEGGRTAFGCSVETFAHTVSGMGVDAIGINCSLGPIEMLPLARRLMACTPLPVCIKPNAGLPRLDNGRTVYDISQEEFCDAMARIRLAGADVLGGCCGTTPDYIRMLRARCDALQPAREEYVRRSVVCSSTRVVEIDGCKIVGERINPTGKKRFQQALREQDYDYVLAQGTEQEEQGAHILDVNVGINGIDEVQTMCRVVDGLQRVTTLPLQIDSANPAVLEAALRRYHGKAIVNSVNGTEESLCTVLPIVAKYGAAVIGLTLDEAGISPDVDTRVAIARKIIDRCRTYGIPPEDIYIDTLTMAQASVAGSALCTVGALAKVHALGVRTVLGISNISFGMPNRDDINAAFLQMSRESGLDLSIIHPRLQHIRGSKEAFAFLHDEPGATERYIAYATRVEQSTIQSQTAQVEQDDLQACIVGGRGEQVAARVKQMLAEGVAPLQIAADYMIPALDRVGNGYEQGTIFLPQLIAAADAAKRGFAMLEEAMGSSDARPNTHTFVLATVKGDIHDIGKNIVKAVVSNYGYRVVDLGRDVPYADVLQAVRKEYPCALGLSALMTTTAQNMAHTIELVRAEFPDLPILVGGAVLTPQYAESIGGIYCKDANATVRELQKIFAD